MVQNKGVIFKQIPNGFPVPGKDLTVETREFDLEQAPSVFLFERKTYRLTGCADLLEE